MTTQSILSFSCVTIYNIIGVKVWRLTYKLALSSRNVAREQLGFKFVFVPIKSTATNNLGHLETFFL